jgi:outer membrane biosynthesis protein TonB
MRTSFVASLALHAGALGLAFVSLPEFMRTRVVEAPVIPIELIDKAELAERTSVPAAAPKPKPLPEIKPEPPAEKPPEPPKAEEKKEPEPKKEPPPAEPKKEPEKDPPKKDPPKKDPPKQPDDLDLDALAALIDKSKKKSPAGGPSDAAEESETPREAVGAGDRLTVTEIDKMRAAVARCWNASAILGAPNPETLVVEIDIDLNRDGTLAGTPRVVNAAEIALSGNRFWKVAEQNAVRAVQACQPYDFFDPARYQDWRAFTLNFDPSIMAGF